MRCEGAFLLTCSWRGHLLPHAEAEARVLRLADEIEAKVVHDDVRLFPRTLEREGDVAMDD